MGSDCRSIAQSTGTMPIDSKFDGPGIDSVKYEGEKAPNVGKR